MKIIASILCFLPFLLFCQTDKPNIVFLLVDDVGWGDFGCYGATFNETPNIDKLSKDGMLFTNGYAASAVCSPSRAAILAGKYPAKLQLTDWIGGHNYAYAKLAVPDWNKQLAHKEKLLPEVLKEQGYSTAFFGKWHLMPTDKQNFNEHYPTSHGFDINVGGREWGQPKGRGKYFSPFDMPNLDNGKKNDFLTDKLTNAAITYLDTVSKKDPFLLYFSYYTIHGPVMAPKTIVKKYKKKASTFVNTKNEYVSATRAAMVERLDVSVGKILDKLNTLGIADNTIIILTGDNGGNYDQTTNGLRGYKGFAYEGGVREPLLVKWPNNIVPGIRSAVPVMGIDFYPTILDMAGAPNFNTKEIDGESIVPVLTGARSKLKRKSLFWHYPHYHRTKPYGSIINDNWKLLEFFEDGKLELYNLTADPNETTNLANSNVAKVRKLKKKLEKWRASVGAQMMKQNPNYNPAKANLRVK